MKVSVTESKYSEYTCGFSQDMKPGDVGVDARNAVVIAVDNGDAVVLYNGSRDIFVQSLHNLRKLELRKPINGLTIMIEFSKED
ncbi:hypothetical protein LCGC14_2595180, partial [marine sediment metagenome]